MSRVDNIVEWLPDERSAALITSPLSLRYICGFPIENSILLVFRERSEERRVGKECGS